MPESHAVSNEKCQLLKKTYAIRETFTAQALQGYSDATDMAETLSQRIRARLAAEMSRKHLSQTDIANLLQWSQPRVSKILHGRTQIGLDELEGLCFAVGITLVEAVRDHGLEFLAEMTPTELRVLERIRQLPKPVLDAVMTLLDVRVNTKIQERRATPHKKR